MLPMTRTFPRWQLIGATLMLLLLCCACASTPPQCSPGARPVQQPAPPPGIFSRCLREILAVGRGERDQISDPCSALLR